MTNSTPITCLFLDIGGVLLTDGWVHPSRAQAAQKFGLDLAELETRHSLTFTTWEEGRISLEEYLDRVVFYQERSFTRAEFRDFMFAQSQPHSEMIALFRGLKKRHGLKVIVVSNETRELNAHRIQTFQLAEWVDAFVSSCFVHLRKPDTDIFRLALDLAHVAPESVLYIENTAMFVQLAEQMEIRSILHTDYQSTRAKLATLGLGESEESIHGSG
jgi:putative hydrolase of the HAD superfamily